MANENTTPEAAQVDEAALNAMRWKLSMAVMPHVIVDRLTNHYGHVIRPEEVNGIVKSALSLLDLHMSGNLQLDDPDENTSDLARAANDVECLVAEVNKRAGADARPFQAVLGSQELMQQALALVQADPNLQTV